jgi:hypothetical protein
MCCALIDILVLDRPHGFRLRHRLSRQFTPISVPAISPNRTIVLRKLCNALTARALGFSGFDDDPNVSQRDS